MEDIPSFIEEIEHYKSLAHSTAKPPVWDNLPTFRHARAAVLGSRAAQPDASSRGPDTPVCIVRPRPDWDCEAARLTLQMMGAECGAPIAPREEDSYWLSNGRELYACDPTLEIGEALRCSEHLPDEILAMEDEAYGAVRLHLTEPDDILLLEKHQYMIERPLCLSADTPELLRNALAVYQGRALCHRSHLPFGEEHLEDMKTHFGLIVE